MRHLIKSSHLLIVKPCSRFGGGKVPYDRQVYQTKINPKMDKELRGYEQMNYLPEYRFANLPFINKKWNYFSLYSIVNYLPLSFFGHVQKLILHPKTHISSDQIHFPKLSENSIPIYNDFKLGYIVRLYSPFFILAVPAFLPFLSQSLTRAAWTYILLFIGFLNPTLGVLRSRLVVRMQLIPQTEEIIYQKINLLGDLTTKKMNISDLEYIQNPNSNLVNNTLKEMVNTQLVFQNKRTKEILYFERQGFWHQEGLYHQLLI